MDTTLGGGGNSQSKRAQGAESVEFGLMRPDEASEVSDVILRAFDEDVAPDCDAQGVQAFSRYADPGALVGRFDHDHTILVASVEGRIVGVIELRKGQHISLLFVDSHHRRRGIARELLRRVLNLGHCGGRTVVEVTVNASPYAVPVYRKLGFSPTGPPRTKDGLRFTPMVLTIDRQLGLAAR
jgi:GNAT superfamily N-acetyltransferase